MSYFIYYLIIDYYLKKNIVKKLENISRLISYDIKINPIRKGSIRGYTTLLLISFLLFNSVCSASSEYRDIGRMGSKCENKEKLGFRLQRYVVRECYYNTSKRQ